MFARAPLPRAVNAVGDRIIDLNYKIDRKSSTRKYIEDSKDATRLEFDQLKNSYYSLSEFKTKKSSDNRQDSSRRRHILESCKNPLKLNCRLRKCLYKLSNDEIKQLQYSTFEKINTLWQQYAKINLKENVRDSLSIFRMDLHGCLIKCTASKNPTLVGAEGIIVQETRNTFLVIRKTNRLLTLPKRESIFEFVIDGSGDNGGGDGGRKEESVYRIHGSNLLLTPQARTKAKYKQKKCQADI